MMEDILKLKASLQSPKEVVILSHRNPDGDAIGSSMAMRQFLESFGHNVSVIFPSEFPSNFEFLPGVFRSHIYDLDPAVCKEKIGKAEAIFCLDFNALDRIDKLGEDVQFSQAMKVMIDHHLDPEPFADIVISIPEASSTCELIYKVIDEMGFSYKINPQIGECLFTGLMTDTGSFRYSTTSYTYQVASALKRGGVDDYELANKIFNSQKEKHLRILGHCLANRMEIIDDCGLGIMWLTKQDYVDLNIQRGDTEGIVNYLLLMDKVKVGVLVLEQPSIIKLSLRSKGDISVQEIASKHFNGGGHKNASGGGVYASLQDVIAKVKKIIPPILNSH